MPVLEHDLWLGTEAALESAVQVEARAAAAAPQYSASYMSELQDFIDSKMSFVQDGVMVISVAGSLVSGDSGIGALFGNVGYSDIRRMFMKAGGDSVVKSILLDVGSGGGAVAGVNDAVSLIAAIGKLKPVVTYAGGNMASAAYWLGAQGREVFVSPTAIVGSIGVIQVHMSRVKQLADRGIEATVVRAGSEKMLQNPYERLTDAAKAQMQAQADALYDVFLESVATARGVSTKTADRKFGQGRVFVGQQAVDAGLADKVGTYDEAFARAAALGKSAARAASKPSAVNKQNVQGTTGKAAAAVWQNSQQLEGTQMPNPAISAELRQAMAAAGIDVDAVTAAQSGDAAGDAADTAQAAAPDTTQATAAPAVPELVAQLASAQADAIVARNEAAQAAAALATANASHEAQLTALNGQLNAAVDIVRDSVRTMGVHFGVSKEGVKALSATEVLAEHSRLRGLFVEKFPVGRVSAVGGTADTAAQAAAPTNFADREFARAFPNAKK